MPIEVSDILMEYYGGKSSFGLEKYFEQIDQWVDREPSSDQENIPLLIEGGMGSGKKTLLVKWIEHRRKLKKEKVRKKLVNFRITRM